MITKSERDQMVKEIVEVLVESERFHEQDFLNRFSGFDTAEVKRSIWRAREIVREQCGIVFGVVPKWPGNFRRLDYQQTANQAKRQRAAGTRKHERAEAKLRIAADHAPDAEKERLREAADRIALRLAMRQARTT
jgi:hypothetical protein